MDRTRFERWGYALCWRGDWITRLWAPIWFRFYCPAPRIDDCSVRACIAAGHCGCDNSAAQRTDVAA